MTANPCRRQFIRDATLGLAVLGFAPTRVHIIPRARPLDVLVLGAGMAGMGVAKALLAKGHKVTILEARSRAGGRVLTLRSPFAEGLYAEAGAMQVFDSHRRVQQLLRELSLPTDPIVPSSHASVTYVLGQRVEQKPGESITWPFELTASERDPRRGSFNAQYVNPHLPGVLEAEANGTLLDRYAHHDRITFSDFLREQGASRAAIAVINAGLPSGLGDGGDHHSALNLLREAAHRSVRRQSLTIRGGTDRLPHALASALSANIQYGTAATRIEQDERSVRVTAMASGSPREFSCDRLVCTLPFSVLRRLEVKPAFSAPKRRAIEGLRYTSVVRVFVQTRTRFWHAAGLSGNASTDLPVMGVYERNINQPGTRGMLESYQAGAQARRTTALSESERVASAIAGMSRVFPQLRDQVEGGASKSWDDDEWSRGGYAWFGPGEMSALMPHVAGAEGRIHFAGEHASSNPGWMEGALESAERVAQEIESASQV